MPPVLRDYQRGIVECVRQSYAEGKRAPMVVLATGGGKTVLFSYVADGAVSKGKTVLILAHRQEILKQISLSISSFDIEHSIIAADKTKRQIMADQFRKFGRTFTRPGYAAKCFVASVQTLIKRLDVMPEPDLIVIDESHHSIRESTWGKIIERYPNAKLMLVTATPIRLDGQGLGVDSGGFADDLILGPTPDILMERGFLSKYKVYTPPGLIDLSGVKTRAGDYAKNDLSNAVDRPGITGDAVSYYKKLADGKRAVAFCVSVLHAEHVAAEFCSNGIPAVSVDGSLEDSERERRIKGLESGEYLVLTSCDLISEGVDIPAIEVAILLRPTKSLSLYLQQVGRALRPAPGKSHAIIIDHVCAMATHGFPDDMREWSLDGIVKRKNDEEPEVKVAVCNVCFATYRPAKECPYCGEKPPEPKVELPEVIEGELVEITEEERNQMQFEKRRAVGQARTLEELQKVAQSLGYSKGWAYHVFKSRAKKMTAEAV